MPPISGQENKSSLYKRGSWGGETSTSTLVNHEPMGRMSWHTATTVAGVVVVVVVVWVVGGGGLNQLRMGKSKGLF